METIQRPIPASKKFRLTSARAQQLPAKPLRFQWSKDEQNYPLIPLIAVGQGPDRKISAKLSNDLWKRKSLSIFPNEWSQAQTMHFRALRGMDKGYMMISGGVHSTACIQTNCPVQTHWVCNAHGMSASGILSKQIEHHSRNFLEPWATWTDCLPMYAVFMNQCCVVLRIPSYCKPKKLIKLQRKHMQRTPRTKPQPFGYSSGWLFDFSVLYLPSDFSTSVLVIGQRAAQAVQVAHAQAVHKRWPFWERRCQCDFPLHWTSPQVREEKRHWQMS